MSPEQPPINLRKVPLQARAAATVDAVMEATARILEESGVEGVNTNLVAERAGVSVGSLYQYFPSKESIFAELIRCNRQVLITDIEVAIAETDAMGLEPAIEALLKAALRHQFERPKLALALEYAEEVLPMGSESRALNTGFVDIVTTLLKANDIRNPKDAARDIVALVKGIIDAAALEGDQDPDALLVRLKRVVIGYLP
ncbi:hypothetical protein A9Q83_05970 [Alphaproteobacteria bacterium 46_93_T64]|nr:hypothetical protein A9Q83_05970 [Alphaproteobacteria bacterium 46_93_T64]